MDIAEVTDWVTGLQQIVLSTNEVEDFLQQVATLAVQAVPVEVSAGITLEPGSRPVTVASGDELALAVDEIQYSVGAGPCLAALHTGQECRIVDLLDEQRWPAFSRQAIAHGVRSVLSAPLTAPTGTVGALNLYGTWPDVFRTRSSPSSGCSLGSPRAPWPLACP